MATERAIQSIRDFHGAAVTVGHQCLQLSYVADEDTPESVLHDWVASSWEVMLAAETALPFLPRELLPSAGRVLELLDPAVQSAVKLYAERGPLIESQRPFAEARTQFALAANRWAEARDLENLLGRPVAEEEPSPSAGYSTSAAA